MKKILLLAAVITTSVFAFTQEDTSPKVRFGLEFTPININNLVATLDALNADAAAGVAGKLVIERPFSDAAYLSTGIEVATFKADLSYPAGVADTSVTNIEAKTTLINIPISLKLRTSQFGLFTPFGQIGFEPGFGINNDFQNTVDDKIEASFITNFPISLALGTEFHISDRNAAYASFFYKNGFTNFINDKYTQTDGSFEGDGEKISLNNLGLRIGFLF